MFIANIGRFCSFKHLTSSLRYQKFLTSYGSTVGSIVNSTSVHAKVQL